MEALGKRRIPEISRGLGVELDDVQDALQRIARLDPRPGRDFLPDNDSYVVPEVFIQKSGEEYVVTTNNDHLPRLRISNTYKDLLSQADSSAGVREYLDPAGLEAAITPRTRAVIPVHLYGQAADMDPILEISRRHGLVVIEDACQAHGAEYKGRRAGSMGDMGCFSFYPGKNLGAYGEGGMVVTDNPEYARKIRMLRDWGAEQKYQHVLKGYNYRLEGIQGAVLRVKLRHLEAWTEARRAAAACYDRLLAGSGVPTPEALPHNRQVYHIYAIRTAKRQAWMDALLKDGVQTGIHYPIPVHLLPAYSDLGYRAGQFPHSERAANEVLSLPMFPELTPAQCETVSTALRKLAGVAGSKSG